ncbi:thermonuclease family protein [Maledivibacter halophilus]|uniref:Endonuclease YncB, thermonuclease family n=1 Tax=Maledivibacter halophilus TaxID=36842 RepID=A0A1T5M641_9FIRM|nr:thermonuclease family protein [Maledivibacter halophilus]SKC83697.1 Endonuclease YncB, thermonuclease family [Maledivibacter halophilus]
MKKIFFLIIIALLLFLVLPDFIPEESSSMANNNSSEFFTKIKDISFKIKDSIGGHFTEEDRDQLKKDLSNLIYKLRNIITKEEMANIKERAVDLVKEINNSLWNNLGDSDYERAIVKRVVDGDTIEVILNGLEEKIRLIGVNTPESVGKYKNNPQVFGKNASSFTKASLLGKVIYLEKDVGDKDKYGRLLRYVWLTDPSTGNLQEDMFNAILLKEGYGSIMTIQPNVKYQKIFLKLEREARENNRGLWQFK